MPAQPRKRDLAIPLLAQSTRQHRRHTSKPPGLITRSQTTVLDRRLGLLLLDRSLSCVASRFGLWLSPSVSRVIQISTRLPDSSRAPKPGTPQKPLHQALRTR